MQERENYTRRRQFVVILMFPMFSTELPLHSRTPSLVLTSPPPPAVSHRLRRSIVRWLVALFLPLSAAPAQTTVSMQGEKFYINGIRTHANNAWDGTLPNCRMVNATFDDANSATVSLWKYPDGSPYNPARQTNEFVAALPLYRANGLLAVSLNFQGGRPLDGTGGQPWDNSAFNSDGSLKPAYLMRIDQAIRALDAQGMVAILGYFYFGQSGRLASETAVRNATANATQWVLSQGYRNVLIEIANETDSPEYAYPILQPPRVIELIKAVQTQSASFGRRLYVSTSFTGGVIPPFEIAQAEDFILLHGNNQTAAAITSMVNTVRGYNLNKPVMFNEDSTDIENFESATNNQASWGYHDTGQNNYVDGFQTPPTNWSINTAPKKNFFNLLATPLKPIRSMVKTGAVVTVNFDSAPNIIYQMQSSGALGSAFSNLGSPQTGSGSTLTFTDLNAPADRRFYRVIVP